MYLTKQCKSDTLTDQYAFLFQNLTSIVVTFAIKIHTIVSQNAFISCHQYASIHTWWIDGVDLLFLDFNFALELDCNCFYSGCNNISQIKKDFTIFHASFLSFHPTFASDIVLETQFFNLCCELNDPPRWMIVPIKYSCFSNYSEKPASDTEQFIYI